MGSNRHSYLNRFCGDRSILAALFFFGVFSSVATAGSPGTTSANFLKLGIGGRGSAMAGAQAAVADDATAAYWNPANLSLLRYNEVSLMHYSLVEGVRYQHAGVALPKEKIGTIAFGVNMLDYGSIQGYDEGSVPTGNLDASNLLLSAAWGKQPFPRSKLSLGANLKYLDSKLAGYSASAPMLDIGVLYPFETGQFRGLKLAATLRNLGPDLKYDVDGTPLPRQFVLGAGYQMFGGNLIFDLDLVQPKDNTSFFAGGLEYKLFNMLLLRAGYTGEADFIGNGVTYGMGLKFNQWNLDYAFVPYGDLGGTNRVSVGIRFGHALKMMDASDQVEMAYRRAESLLQAGNGVQAYSTLNDLLLIAPWHQPSVSLKSKIEKQFNEMASSKNKAKMEAEIADAFTAAKSAFDRDELVEAKKGFDTILKLQFDHIGAKVYLERIQNRYAALAQSAYKDGMSYYAAGDYEKAKAAFEKTLSIDPAHADAKAQLLTTDKMIVDATLRDAEMKRLSSAADAYRAGLEAFQKNDFETALTKFSDVRLLAPGYEEVARYESVTKVSLGGVLFEQSQVHMENGQYDEAVIKLKRAHDLMPNDARFKSALDIAIKERALKYAEESKRIYQEGLTAFLGGDTAKAEKNWKRALELDSQNEDALRALTKLEEQKAQKKAQEKR